MEKSDISFFDPKAEWSVIERGLPHWSQAGCLCFVTWRLNDSLPKEVHQRIDRDIAAIQKQEGIDPDGNWKQQIAQLPPSRRGEIQWRLFATYDHYLDLGQGGSYLASPQCAHVVLNSLQQFDMDRYFLTDAIIMPNHVHFLCAFTDEQCFLKQCNSWKRFTARQINATLRRAGEFWQVDQFDHLIRSPEQFEHYRRYIANNPIKAKLTPGSYLYYQKQLT